MTHRKLPVTCPDCWGSGKNDNGSGKCPKCGGKGTITVELEERER